MPPRLSRVREQSAGQGDLFYELAAMQPQQGAVSEGAVATAGVTQAVVGELATKKPDLGRAMDLLSLSISGLGGANKMDGLQGYATLKRGEADLQERYGSKYWYVIGVTEGAGGTLRRHAFYDYCRAAEAIAGRRLQRDDPAVALGFRAFASVHGKVGRSAQSGRRRARADLDRARRDNASKIPIEHFYDPDLEIYADSSLKLTASWRGISRRVTGEGSNAEEHTAGHLDTSVNGLLREVLWPDTQTQLLAEKDKRLVIDNADSYAAKICSVIQASRYRQRLDGHINETPQNVLDAAYRGVRKALGAHQDVANNRLAELRKQFDIADQLTAYLAAQRGEYPYRNYTVTNKSLDTIARMTDDFIDTIATSRRYNEEDRATLSASIRSRLGDAEYARGFVGVLAAHNQTTQTILEQNRNRLAATLATYEHVPAVT